MYNRAMFNIFRVDDSLPGTKAQLLAFSKPKSREEKVAAKLRSIMELQSADREYLARKVACKKFESSLE